MKKQEQENGLEFLANILSFAVLLIDELNRTIILEIPHTFEMILLFF